MEKEKQDRTIKKNCFKCDKEIFVKFNPGTIEYVKKNNWGYWTEKEENKEKYICDGCLLNLYYKQPKEYLAEVKNKEKRRVFSAYIYDKTFSS